MLWSLLKIVVFVVIVAALTLGAGYLLELGDVVLVTVGGREFALTPLVAVIVALLLLLAVWLIIRLAGLLVATLRFLNGDETAISRYFNRRAEKRGYDALSDGIMALAAGEGRLAIRKAQRAESYLHRPDLTNLVIAQGAEMVGDTALATETLKQMVQHDRTRFVGIRGLIKQKLQQGDTDTAMKLAEKALAIRPQNAEVQDLLLGLQTRDEDWKGARKTLTAKLKAGNLPRDVHKRRDAVLALAHARDALAEGKIDTARAEAYEANRLSPHLVPAAVMAARMSVEEGKPRAATRILKKAWEVAPHPDLAAAFAAIEPGETPEARLKRFRPLLARHPEAVETRLLNAELLIAADNFDKARKVLGPLPESDPDARTLTLMAAIERGTGGEDRLVRAWLAKAVTAPRGPQWMCSNCGHVHADWRPTCENCDSFDTLEWETPKQSEAALSGAAHMLPLIVGALEDRREEETAAEDAPPDEAVDLPAEVAATEDAEVIETGDTEAESARN
ncbi:tetratricopeptide repeat protein [Rhodobacterales bacterium HKCCE2091]|nr:tetratricopeptide repeat protein [Rhodobacterales bacterium HKCCE2091]